MKRVWITLGLLLFLVVGLAALAGLLFQRQVRGGVELMSPAILEVDLEGQIVEKFPEDPFIARAEGASHQLVDIQRAIRAAARDDRVSGIYLRVGVPGYGWAKAEEIRDALLAFRESGKFVYAYLAPTDELGYYVALAADSLYLLPDGLLELNGFSVETPYILRLFEKLGLEPQVEQVGIYKSAADMLKRNEMSDAEREATEAILRDRYERFVKAVTDARGLEPAEFAEAFDRGIYLAADVVELGLVDDELYEAEVRALALQRAFDGEVETLQKGGPPAEGEDTRVAAASLAGRPAVRGAGLGGEDSDSVPADTAAEEEVLESDAPDNVIGVEDYVSLLPPATRGQGGTIAVVYAVGAIASGEDAVDPLFGRTMGSATFIELLREIAANERVDAAVIRIDSPGGDAIASEEIWAQIEELRRLVPVVVSMSDVAGSGGYYIAVAGDRILAQPSTITGSIGVLGVVFNAADTFDKLGIGWGSVKTNEAADFPTSIRPLTEPERATFRSLIEDTYRSFVERVAEGRERTYEQIDSVAQGRIWSGTQAKEQGLVDEVGGLEAAIDEAKSLAEIDPKAPVGLLIYPKEKTFLERLKDLAMEQGAVHLLGRSRSGPGEASALPLLRELGRTLTAAGVALREGPGRPLAVMPFVPRIH